MRRSVAARPFRLAAETAGPSMSATTPAGRAFDIGTHRLILAVGGEPMRTREAREDAIAIIRAAQVDERELGSVRQQEPRSREQTQ